MRKLVLLIGSAVVMSGSSPTLAATDEPLFGPMTPARVSGTWVYQDRFEGHVEQSDESMLMSSVVDSVTTGAFHSDDPRLGGTVTATSNWTGAYPPALLFVVETRWLVEDAVGSWTGSSRYVSSMADDDPINVPEQLILEGSGGYEGLTLYITLDYVEEAFLGAIIPHEMPELPSDWMDIWQATAEEE